MRIERCLVDSGYLPGVIANACYKAPSAMMPSGRTTRAELVHPQCSQDRRVPPCDDRHELLEELRSRPPGARTTTSWIAWSVPPRKNLSKPERRLPLKNCRKGKKSLEALAGYVMPKECYKIDKEAEFPPAKAFEAHDTYLRSLR